MRYRKLGTSDLTVSEICLGTMTWGTQNTQDEGFAQMDYALAQGVTFWDTAELYPVNPAGPTTYGNTEKIIGNWLAERGGREKIVLASKVGGPGRDWLRNGEGFTVKGMKTALEDSLVRLKTEYIDLYQLHWPQRGSYHFGQNWFYAAEGTVIEKHATSEVVDQIHQTLETLQAFVTAGKIRYVGLSNETAWGTSQFLKLAEQHGLPRVVSVQNEYSLMYRLCDLDMAEVCLRENVGLLPYSPLAAGWLSGKYYAGARPENCRFTLGPTKFQSTQRITDNAQKAADAYVDLARQHGLDPAQMAIAFTLRQPFVASTIIGATSMEQLIADIGSADVVLSEAVMAGIHGVRQAYPMPY